VDLHRVVFISSSHKNFKIRHYLKINQDCLLPRLLYITMNATDLSYYVEPIYQGIQKVREILEYFVVWLAVLLRPGHTVPESQTATCCECGMKMVANKGLHQGRATLIPSLAAISEVVTLQFPRIVAWANSMLYSSVDVAGRPYLSAWTTLVRLLLNISIHSYTLHPGKQFWPYLAANCRWISTPFIPSDTKTKRTI
jgi:hypothetical protein